MLEIKIINRNNNDTFEIIEKCIQVRLPESHKKPTKKTISLIGRNYYLLKLL